MLRVAAVSIPEAQFGRLVVLRKEAEECVEVSLQLAGFYVRTRHKESDNYAGGQQAGESEAPGSLG